ncbi:hypothetical protein ANAPRD1_01262 [Anaplasma phagocytophilum]|nr:hypothetical protein ANAPRD1_01262 [Anaplasma phagocytophilum]
MLGDLCSAIASSFSHLICLACSINSLNISRSSSDQQISEVLVAHSCSMVSYLCKNFSTCTG